MARLPSPALVTTPWGATCPPYVHAPDIERAVVTMPAPRAVQIQAVWLPTKQVGRERVGIAGAWLYSRLVHRAKENSQGISSSASGLYREPKDRIDAVADAANLREPPFPFENGLLPRSFGWRGDADCDRFVQRCDARLMMFCQRLQIRRVEAFRAL
jgi:hypothetical protein